VHILAVGLATVDLVYRVDRLPGVDEKVQATSVETATGGPAANAAVVAAALGASVTLVTAVGAHPLGVLIRADLRACGVTLSDATPDASGPPPVSAVTVLSSTGTRSVVSRNAGDIRAGVPADLESVVASADVVLVDGHHPLPAVAAVRAARRAGRPVVVDAGSWKPVMAQLLPSADVVACSADFRHPWALPAVQSRLVQGDAVQGDAAIAAALRADGVRHIAVTHGPDPVRWWSGDRDGTEPVPPAVAVDTAGAGDVFHGALAVAVARDPAVADLVAALRYAVAVAGVRIAHAGPRAWLADPRLVHLAGKD
jgi:sugar/nucleoside kinase (ribokinase family)